jgi:hypothetical protein
MHKVSIADGFTIPLINVLSFHVMSLSFSRDHAPT